MVFSVKITFRMGDHESLIQIFRFFLLHYIIDCFPSNFVTYFREKRLDKERDILNEQITLLTNEITKQNNEVVTLRREHTAQLIDYQNRLQVKDEEVS